MDPESQVSRFKVLIEKLGEFPDRDLIYQIWQSAKLGLETGGIALAQSMANSMLDLLEETQLVLGRRVPLLYALDAIVKNLGAAYQLIFAGRLKKVFELSFSKVNEKDKARMHHVLRTWNEKKIFLELIDDLNTLVTPWYSEFLASQEQALSNQYSASAPALPTPALSTPALPTPALPTPVQDQQPVRVAQRLPRYQPPPPATMSSTPEYQSFQDDRRAKRLQGVVVAKTEEETKKDTTANANQEEDPPLVPPAQPISIPLQKKQRKMPNLNPRVPKKKMRLQEIQNESPAVAALARDDLYALQMEMNEADPMSLEEIAASQPDLFERLIIESRTKLQAQRSALQLVQDWPPPVPPGPLSGSSAADVIQQAQRLADSLEYRVTAFSRKAAPSTLTKVLAQQAEGMATHLRTLSKRREHTADFAAKIAQNLISKLATQAATTTQEPLDELRRIGIRAACSIPKSVAFLSEPFLSAHAFHLSRLTELTHPDPGALQAMYQAPRFIHQQDALRFDTRQELETHSAQSASTNTSRVWAPSQRQWTTEHLLEIQRKIELSNLNSQHQSIDNIQEAQQDAQTPEEEHFQPVPAPPDGTTRRCPVCGDAFDLEYREDSFVLQDAVLVPVQNGHPVAVHIRCRDATCGRHGTLRPEDLLNYHPEASSMQIDDTAGTQPAHIIAPQDDDLPRDTKIDADLQPAVPQRQQPSSPHNTKTEEGDDDIDNLL